MGTGHEMSTATRIVGVRQYNKYFRHDFKQVALYLPYERGIGQMAEVVFYEHRKSCLFYCLFICSLAWQK